MGNPKSVHKKTCTTCGDNCFHNIRLYRRRSTSEVIAAGTTDSCSAEELVTSVLHELAGQIYNGMTGSELCKILRNRFGIWNNTVVISFRG